MYVWDNYFRFLVSSGFATKFWFFLRKFLDVSPIPKILISLCILSFVLYIIRSRLLS